MRGHAHSGFTVVELLITLGIFVVVLGIAGQVFVSQVRLAEQTEARNDMQVNLRAAMEMLTNDLYSAGSEGVSVSCTLTAASLASTRPSAQKHTVTSRYCDPYTGNSNTVAYELRPDANNGNLSTLYRRFNAAPIAPAIPGIVAMAFDFTCDVGAVCNPTAVGFDPNTVTSVTVKLTAQSSFGARGATSTCTFDGTPCTTKANYYYEYAEQTISPPNLKLN